jgi:hypothetical protein
MLERMPMKVRLFSFYGMVRVLAGVCLIAVGCGAMQAQTTSARPDLTVKTESNIKNDRKVGPQTVTPGTMAPTAATPAAKENEPPPKKHLAGVQYTNRTAAPSTGADPVAPTPKPPTPMPMDAAKIKSHSNQANNREAETGNTGAVAPAPKPMDSARVKSHSNHSNNRSVQPAPVPAGSSGPK